jgi:hypothetical protein
MFNQNPEIPFPDHEKTTIWRYMTFTAFVDLLDSSSLYFSRLDALDDPFEGHGTAMDYLKQWFPEQLFRAAAQPAKSGLSRLGRWRASRSAEQEQKQTIEILRRIRIRETCWANCWHAGEDEDVALWRIYAGADKTIVIKSSIAALRDALGPDVSYDISLGMVGYDDGTARTARHPAVLGAMTKSRHFAFEREMRAVLLPSGKDRADFGRGVKVPVETGVLTNAVMVSPNAPAWIADLVGRLMAHYGLTAPCLKSRLYAHADFEPAND